MTGAMGTEIERKFLVVDTPWLGKYPSFQLRQGYLSTTPERTVRVRIEGARGWLTIKGRPVGAARAEFEYEIPVTDAEQLLAMCPRPIIEKTRHKVVHAGHTWEVDVFSGDNAGLLVAEIELQDEQESFVVPEWVGQDVTADPAYSNAQLSIRPFNTWTSSC